MISRRIRVSQPLVGIVALLVTLMGCDNLTRVNAPDVLQSPTLNTAPGALTRAAGANGTFAFAVSAAVSATGLLADEFRSTGFVSQVTEIDQRNFPPYQSISYGYPYDYLSRGRIAALRALQTLQRYNPSQTSLISQMFSNLGFTEVMFAENMCSGVPLGSIDANGNPLYEPRATRTVLLQLAAAHFDSALHYAADDSASVYAAMVGSGRALAGQGNWSAAVTAVANVPVVFSDAALFTSTQVSNQTAFLLDYELESVADRKGEVGLDFISAQDPRVLVSSIGLDAQGDSSYVLTAYNTLTSSIIVASGIEARLIVAEATLPTNGGSGSAWLDTLNSLRLAVGDSALHDPGTDSARVDLLFRERAFWLFGTNHRQGDLRRLVQLYGRSASLVFPHGPYNGGPLPFGNAVSFTSFGETGNPNPTTCISQSP